jgi:hypothetical protein
MIKFISMILFGSLFSLNISAEQLLRDPTKPSIISPKTTTAQTDTATKITLPSLQKWVLETTLADSKRIIAIINGQQVKVGDEVDGAYVMKITDRRVTLKHDGKLFDIKLATPY